MGSTVSTGKLVGAFRGNNGLPVYVLFEQTYESNCYPHTPSWGAQMIGDLQAAIRRIFLSGSACEAGSLQGAGGRDITPEGYIAGWMKEMANPIEVTDSVFELVVGDSWSSPIPRGDYERVKALLEDMGADRFVAGLQTGNVMASLHADHELLSAIYDGTRIGAWRIIKHLPDGPRNAALGYNPVKAKVHAFGVPRFLRVHSDLDRYLIQDTDGRWRCHGAAYSYVADFVAKAWSDELREPGSYRTRIKTYREAVESAMEVPGGAQIIVSDLPHIKEWIRRDMDRILADTPHCIIEGGVQMNAPIDCTQLYSATRLPPEQTEWVFSFKAPNEQLCLLAS